MLPHGAMVARRILATAPCFAPLITGRKAINNPVSAIIFLYLLADLSDKQATSRNRKTAEILYFQGFLPF
jgi:hypothetical protein